MTATSLLRAEVMQIISELRKYSGGGGIFDVLFRLVSCGTKVNCARRRHRNYQKETLSQEASHCSTSKARKIASLTS